MVHVLIVQGHPDPAENHLCHGIADAYAAAAREGGHEVNRITVAKEVIPFVQSKTDWESTDLPKVATAGQEAVGNADHIVLIYPLWMGDIPAILKAWIEQVFRPTFAFSYDGSAQHPALKGKSARIIVTMGMPSIAYRWFFLAHSLRSLDRNILKFCGIRPVRWSIFGNAEDPSGRTQANCIMTAAKLGATAG